VEKVEKKSDKRSPREIARANKAARRAFETGNETKDARK